MEFFDLEICGLRRKLPLTYLGRKTLVANFSLLGDVALVEKVADELVKRLKSSAFDYLVGPEVKVVPLIHGLAKRLGSERYIILRKSVKPYMVAPVILKPLPYFPKHVRQLVIDGEDAALLRGKKVVLVDDVMSTGATLRLACHLMEKIGAEVAACAVVLMQGERFPEAPEPLFLQKIPLLTKRNNSPTLDLTAQ